MHIQSISALTDTLTKAGFDPAIGYRLMRHACFGLARFSLTECIACENDLLTCTIHIERKGDEYECPYYDAALLKSPDPAGLATGVEYAQLEREMAAIDWPGSAAAAAKFRIQDASSWENEKQIAAIVSTLTRLSATEEGKYYCDYLKIKFWQQVRVPEIAIQAIRQKLEVSQRFYFFKGDAIATGEAYRFLVNRWLEKKMQGQRRQHPPGKPASNDNEGEEKVRNGRKSGRRGKLSKK